jgi:hypothetical protein
MQLSNRSELRDLPTPRFDDERTLLSARPVVPLAEVSKEKSKARFKWQRGAIGLGLMSLVISAGLVISRNGKSKETQAASEPEVTAQGPASATEKTQDSVVPSTASDSEPNTAQTKRQAPKIKVAVDNSEKTEPERKRTVAVPVEDANSDDSESQIEEWRLRQARREERRLERRARREEWRRAGDRDDVFRINDIFEGRRRP